MAYQSNLSAVLQRICNSNFDRTNLHIQEYNAGLLNRKNVISTGAGNFCSSLARLHTIV